MHISETKGNASLFEIAAFYFNQKKREGAAVGGGEGGTDCDAAESVFQIKKLNKRPQGQSWTPRKEVVNVESRTGCDTLLSSPGKVGYFRTFHTQKAETGKHREASAPTLHSFILHQPLRGCCQLALQELRSTSWLLSGGDAISAGSLIQLVIFGFQLLCGWAKAHCLAQMNCPWQISQKPGSLPCLLLIQWKWTRPWSPLLVSDVSIPHLGVLHLFNKCWASYCVLDNTRLWEYEYNKYGTCSQAVGSLDFSILLETSYPAILIVGCLKTSVSWWGWVFSVQGTQDQVLFFPLTSCVTSSKHDSVLGP